MKLALSPSFLGLFQQIGSRHRLQKMCQSLRVELGLLDHPSTALINQKPGVGRLVVIHGERKGNKYRSSANRRYFCHGAGARAADDQVRVGKGLRRVLYEWNQLGSYARSRIVA